MASKSKSKTTSAKNKPIAKKSVSSAKSPAKAKPAATKRKLPAKSADKKKKAVKAISLKKPTLKTKFPVVKSKAKATVKKTSPKATSGTKHSATRVVAKKSVPKKVLKPAVKPKALVKKTSSKKTPIKTSAVASQAKVIKTTNRINKTHLPKTAETPKKVPVSQTPAKSAVPPPATHAQQLTELLGNNPDDYMNDEHKSRFRQILIDWKQQLLQEMERTVHHLQDDAASFADPNDRATQEEEFNLELRTRDRELKLIKKIEEALQRLQNNDYGHCEACGVEIGLPRLVARPTATLCIDCKAVAEMQEKPYV